MSFLSTYRIPLRRGYSEGTYLIEDTSELSPDYFNVEFFPMVLGGGRYVIKVKGNGVNMRMNSSIDVEIIDAVRYAKGPLAGKLRVNIDFWYVATDGEIISLNGEQRRDTDKIIQTYVGTFDDFILTALSLQGNNSNFIDKTQGARQDLFANFLDLKIFDSLYEMANKENRVATVLLEEYAKQDFETRLGDAESAKEINEEKHEKAQVALDVAQAELEELNKELLEYNKQLQPCTADGLDIIQLQANLKSTTQKILVLEQSQEASKHILKGSKDVLEKVSKDLKNSKDSFNIPLYNDYKAKLQEKIVLDNTLNTLKLTVANKLSKIEKLKNHEYDPNCKYCTSNVFVKDATEASIQLEDDKKVVHDLLLKIKEVGEFVILINAIRRAKDDKNLSIPELNSNNHLLSS